MRLQTEIPTRNKISRVPKRLRFGVVLVFLILARTCIAEKIVEILSIQQQTEVVSQAAGVVEERYILESPGQRISLSLLEQLAEGASSKPVTRTQFAKSPTTDLRGPIMIGI